MEDNKNLKSIVEPNVPQEKENSEESSFAMLLPNLPPKLPQEPYDYLPPLPRRRYPLPVILPNVLAKRIYLEMLRAIKDYGELEIIAPETDKNTISSLKSQMEILSISMLNVISELGIRPRVPYFRAVRVSLSKDYQTALTEMYERVFYIHELTQKLFVLTTSSPVTTKLLIILTNLKSQLKTLNGLKAK